MLLHTHLQSRSSDSSSQSFNYPTWKAERNKCDKLFQYRGTHLSQKLLFLVITKWVENIKVLCFISVISFQYIRLPFVWVIDECNSRSSVCGPQCKLGKKQNISLRKVLTLLEHVRKSELLFICQDIHKY